MEKWREELFSMLLFDTGWMHARAELTELTVEGLEGLAVGVDWERNGHRGYQVYVGR